MLAFRLIPALGLLLALASPLLAAPLLADESAEEVEEVDIEALLARQIEALNTYVTGMEELAAWADKNDIFACRNLVYEDLILVRPEHKIARRTLRFVKNGDGAWERRGGRPPRDHEKELIPEFNQRFKALRDALLATLHETMDASEGAGVRERISLTVEVLKGFPNDARAREIRGESKKGGKWLLKETVTAERRRDELAESATKAIDDVAEPKTIQPNDLERKLGVQWQGGFQGTWWRALGTVDIDEVKNAVNVLDASHPFFDWTFGIKTSVPRNCGFYLLTGKDEAAKVLGSHPDISARKRDFYLGLRAGWVPGKNVFFHWSDSATVRLDGSTRMALGILILRNFHINTDRGWVWEGLGLYLDYHLTGGHRTIFVTPEMKTTTKRRTPFDIETRMKKPGVDWVQLALDLVDAKSEPEVRSMARRKVNDMSPEDLVYGYALVAYLVEGHPDKVTRFFSMHGTYQPIADTVKQVFDWPLDYFMERYHRWLNEIN